MLFDMKDIQSQKQGSMVSQSKKSTSSEAVEKLARQKAKLKECFGNIPRGADVHYVSAGEWSTHDLVAYILDQIGPASLTCCSWSVSRPALEKLVKMMPRITELNFLMDWRIHQRGKEVAVWLKENATRFKTSNCHAKVTVLRNAYHNITVVGSANWTNNPRIECGVVSTCESIADFHESWIMKEIEGSNPMEMTK